MDNSQSWYRAFYLKERLRLLREASERDLSIPLNKKCKTSSAARKRIMAWRHVAGLDDTKVFKKALKHNGISEAEFIHILTEQNDDWSSHVVDNSATWVRIVESLKERPSTDQNKRGESKNPSARHSFSTSLTPFTNYAVRELKKKLVSLKSVDPQICLAWPRISSGLMEDFEKSLLSKATPSLVLELNIDRLESNLSGDTTQERFESFCKRFTRRDKFTEFLTRYPVLARLLTEATTDWIDAVYELLARLAKDWPVIEAELLGPIGLNNLAAVKMNLSDAHRGGRTVCELEFISGGKLVYKPKPLKVDMHFQDLLRWLNKSGAVPTFPTIRIIDRGPYGWEEHVSQRGCSTLKEVNRFYKRQGGYLAILYMLGGTDIHLENLIASGEYPILVDLETIFNRQLLPSNEGGALKKALMLFDESVIKTGLLPMIEWDSESDADYSGLVGKADNLVVKYWKDKDTDKMHQASRPIRLLTAQNRPLLNGVEIEAKRHIEAIVEGFENTYKIIMNQKGVLLSETGPISAFAGDTVRQVFRPTKTYGMYLDKGHHPDNLQDGLYRDRLMNHLWASVVNRPKIERIVTSECDDLMQDNVPIFTSKTTSLDLCDSKNRRIPDFFEKDGLSIVKDRISALSQHDLDRQTWFVRMAFAVSGERKPSRVNNKSIISKRETNGPIDEERIREAAVKIGHRLAETAIATKSEAMWIGSVLMPNGYLSLMPVGYDLYSGTSGIALFLTYLGIEINNEQFIELARAAIRGARRQLLYKKYKHYEHIVPSAQLNSPGGGFQGRASVIYAMLHIGVILNDPVLLDEALSVVNTLNASIDNCNELDILGGLAGYILVLINLYRQTGAQDPLNAAIKCGDMLLARSEKKENGRVWPHPFITKGPLSGFSHGNAGFAYSLLELANITSEEKFRTAAYEALNYERTLFSKKTGNWQDLRLTKSSAPIKDSGERFFMGWCNGAPGIALARLFSLQHCKKTQESNEIRAEIETAIHTVITHGFNGNYSLCHGVLGNTEPLLVASEILKAPTLKLTSIIVATRISENIVRNNWERKMSGDIETPGLMTGLAGVGFGLLRASSPNKIPSILGLRAPYNSVNLATKQIAQQV